jgi:3'-phosphoadenosine 5'-phosphosulfate sulfotransferase (PAPS reductase)/FAD synthetase
MNPYQIRGPAQVGVSGGRSSAYMAEHILKAHDGKLPSDVHFCFNNTGKEHEATLVFVRDLEKRWGVPITWIEFDGEHGRGLSWRIVTFETASRNSEPFDKVLTYYDNYRREEKGEPPILPNVVARFCSDRMKIKSAEWWMRSMGYEQWDAIIGIRRDEPGRFARLSARNGKERWENVMPMYEAGVLKADVQAYWRAQTLDLGIDSDLGNCDLCFLKHDNKLIRAIQLNPTAAHWWIAHEERTGQRFRKNAPSYRQLAYTADLMKKQMRIPDLEPTAHEQEIDCMCGDAA